MDVWLVQITSGRRSQPHRLSGDKIGRSQAPGRSSSSVVVRETVDQSGGRRIDSPTPQPLASGDRGTPLPMARRCSTPQSVSVRGDWSCSKNEFCCGRPSSAPQNPQVVVIPPAVLVLLWSTWTSSSTSSAFVRNTGVPSCTQGDGGEECNPREKVIAGGPAAQV
jgi:hypothetical protein